MRTDATDIYIEVSFIDYTKKPIANPTIVDGQIDLGNVTLAEDSQQLNELSMSLGVSYRHTEDVVVVVVERVADFEDNISLSRPESIGINNTAGVEY